MTVHLDIISLSRNAARFKRPYSRFLTGGLAELFLQRYHQVSVFFKYLLINQFFWIFVHINQFFFQSFIFIYPFPEFWFYPQYLGDHVLDRTVQWRLSIRAEVHSSWYRVKFPHIVRENQIHHKMVFFWLLTCVLLFSFLEIYMQFENSCTSQFPFFLVWVLTRLS